MQRLKRLHSALKMASAANIPKVYKTQPLLKKAALRKLIAARLVTDASTELLYKSGMFESGASNSVSNNAAPNNAAVIKKPMSIAEQARVAHKKDMQRLGIPFKPPQSSISSQPPAQSPYQSPSSSTIQESAKALDTWKPVSWQQYTQAMQQNNGHYSSKPAGAVTEPTTGGEPANSTVGVHNEAWNSWNVPTTYAGRRPPTSYAGNPGLKAQIQTQNFYSDLSRKLTGALDTMVGAMEVTPYVADAALLGGSFFATGGLTAPLVAEKAGVPISTALKLKHGATELAAQSGACSAFDPLFNASQWVGAVPFRLHAYATGRPNVISEQYGPTEYEHPEGNPAPPAQQQTPNSQQTNGVTPMTKGSSFNKAYARFKRTLMHNEKRASEIKVSSIKDVGARLLKGLSRVGSGAVGVPIYMARTSFGSPRRALLTAGLTAAGCLGYNWLFNRNSGVSDIPYTTYDLGGASGNSKSLDTSSNIAAGAESAGDSPQSPSPTVAKPVISNQPSNVLDPKALFGSGFRGDIYGIPSAQTPATFVEQSSAVSNDTLRKARPYQRTAVDNANLGLSNSDKLQYPTLIDPEEEEERMAYKYKYNGSF